MELAIIGIVVAAGLAGIAEQRRQRRLDREYQEYFNRPPFGDAGHA